MNELKGDSPIIKITRLKDDAMVFLFFKVPD